ncbi:DUF1572 family protein [bacterium SCSIO 12741]|nr:DUF1572 family protein [bacterium SCSIO 12741]
MEANYIISARKQFEYYQALGSKTFDQLSDEDLFKKDHSDGNSIAIVVNHMWGNMRSRWTDFLTADGEKEWRQRDQEFEDLIQSREELLTKWEEGWNCLYSALDSVNEDNFSTPVYIRNQAHTIVDAVNRQLCHYAYHVGQIVLMGKQYQGSDWQSLSIPKGQSKAFNAEKFSRGKHGGHFTDDIK